MRDTVIGVGYATIIESVDENGDTIITYADIKYLNSKISGTRQIQLTPKSNFKEIWADGQVVFAGQKNSGYEGTITTIDLCDDIEEDWYGNEIDSNKTSVELAKSGEMPKFGIVAHYQSTNNDEGYTEVFPYCYCTDRSNFNLKTEEESGMDYEYIEHKVAAKPSPMITTIGDKKGHIVKFRVPGSKKLEAFPEYTVPTAKAAQFEDEGV